jgi:tRNA (guanine37-N1)-methyltransferase
MRIDIVTLFPEVFSNILNTSIIKRAQEKSLVTINVHNLRDWAKDQHKTVDDRPFGGGAGMILKVDVLYSAITQLKAKAEKETHKKITTQDVNKYKTILMDPAGATFNQRKASQLSKLEYLLIVCGHYEGIDERVKEHLIDEEISIGDYVLSGGEIPAMVIVDAITRLLPGVLKKTDAISNESFQPIKLSKAKGLVLEYPQYTRPAEFLGWKVPKVLLSGNHKEIENWKKKESLKKTKAHRPDLLRD